MAKLSTQDQALADLQKGISYNGYTLNTDWKQAAVNTGFNSSSYNVWYNSKDPTQNFTVGIDDTGLLDQLSKLASNAKIYQPNMFVGDLSTLDSNIINTPEKVRAKQLADLEAQVKSGAISSSQATQQAGQTNTPAPYVRPETIINKQQFAGSPEDIAKYGPSYGGGTIQNVSQETPTNTKYAPFTITSNLKYGSRGQEVENLQKYLQGIGLYTGKIDGIFGNITLAAVKQFQSSQGLTADGIVGAKTTAAINAVQSGQPIPDTAKAGTSGAGTGSETSSGAGTDVRDSNGLLINPPDAQFDRNTGQPIADSTTTEDPQITAWKNALTDQYKALYEPLLEWLKLQQENGQKVNPDLTITPALAQQFLTEASAKLDPYYTELIRQNKQDLTIANQQLQTDYEKNIQREQTQFQQNLENQDVAEANAGTAFSSGRVAREGNLITGQQNKLSDYFDTAQRGEEQNAIASERKIGSRVFSELGIPSLQQYAVQPRTIAPSGSFASTGSRSLYTPQGSLEGSLPIEQRTAIGTEVANLSEAERKKRILDAGGTLGSTSLG